MRLRTIAIISVLILVALGEQQDAEVPVSLGEEQGQLEQTQAEARAYYEDGYDDYDQYYPEEQQPEQELSETDEEEQRDMLQFSEHMGDFVPDETFIFNIKPNSMQNFILWPYKDVETIRGMFHSEIDSDELDDYVNLDIATSGSVIRQFKQQRLGIFNIAHNSTDAKYRFTFSSTVAEVQVYVSYEYVTKAKLREKSANVSSVEEAAGQFMKVNQMTLAQENEMSRIISISRKHQERIDKYLSRLEFSILLETAVLVAGSCYTLSLLRKQIYAGYELLV